LVDIKRRPAPAVGEVAPDQLFPLVRAGFATRRKMLRRSLAGLVTPADFEAAGVDPEARAEDLDVAAWGRLAAAANG
jgi:16S rRNA (adenine1518-N6/adenine1519-N6)-dimethyltransferase